MKQTVIAANGLASCEAVKRHGGCGRQRHRFPGVPRRRGPVAPSGGVREAGIKEYGRFPKILGSAWVWMLSTLIRSAFKKAGVGAANEKLCEAIRSPFKGEVTDYDFSSDDLNGIKL